MASLQSTKIIAVPTTGTTVTLANQDGDINLIVNPAGSLLALTIAFPSAPRDGQIVRICSSQILTGLTITTGVTILGALTTMAAANGFASYIYDLAGTTWYRVG